MADYPAFLCLISASVTMTRPLPRCDSDGDRNTSILWSGSTLGPLYSIQRQRAKQSTLILDPHSEERLIIVDLASFPFFILAVLDPPQPPAASPCDQRHITQYSAETPLLMPVSGSSCFGYESVMKLGISSKPHYDFSLPFPCLISAEGRLSP
ncbi:hypothetical protein EDD18DRAFT_533968 [Armillaria luteobubalina]|uniref:Uncharacterized protein n=1 Tax=Armillaria luteobubalina TaxID=153913 RepID=A0AA39UKT5_9AGAR|nr:hypothetical protein EDD18DRAFT_533968 [Armillaria luteobubalina]